MEKKKLIVTVAGQSFAGKSTLTYVLKEFLRNQGYDVKFEPNLDYQTEDEFDKMTGKNIYDRIENFKENREITIREEQLPRDFKFED